MKKAKKKIPEEIQNNNEKGSVNTALLNVISPSSLSHDMNSVTVSDNFGAVKNVIKLPVETDYGWLSKLSSLEGCSTVVNYRPTDSAGLVKMYDDKIKLLKSQVDETHDESKKQSLQRQIKDMRESIRKIDEEKEEIGYVSILLYPHALTKDKMEQNSKKADVEVGKLQGATRVLTHRQLDAIRQIAPWGIPELGQEKIIRPGERNMPISTLLGGFFNAAAGINDEGGYYLGKIDEKYVCRLNMWKRGNDRTNSNWLVTGLPGVGKSTAVKDVFLKDWAFGSKIIVIDPEREYIDLCKNLRGDVIDCGGGKNGKINILQVRKAPRIEDEEDEQDFYKDEGYGLNDLALHLQTVKVFFNLYFKSITDEQMACLEKALIKLYNRFGITWDTDIEETDAEGNLIWTNDKFPIMSDLYEDVVKYSEENAEDTDISDYERKIYQELKVKLYSAAEGADSFVFNGHTNIKTTSRFVVLDNSRLVDGAENIQRAQYYNILSWTWQQVSQNRSERILLGVDEAYLMVDPDVPQAIVFLRNMSKRMRKYTGGLMVITHSVVDLLDPAVKRFGQAIIDNACYKLIMGTEGKNLEETKKLFRLTDKEEIMLAAQKRGQALFYAGAMRMRLQIDVHRKYLKMFGSAGGN